MAVHKYLIAAYYVFAHVNSRYHRHTNEDIFLPL